MGDTRKQLPPELFDMDAVRFEEWADAVVAIRKQQQAASQPTRYLT